MDLFHQTVSMKSVGNLTDFVREHMLEPFDSADTVRALVDHFENLTAAHNAVLKARRMLDGLNAHRGSRRRDRRLRSADHRS